MGGGGNNTDFYGLVAWAVIGRRLAIFVAVIGIAAGLYWMWA